MEQFGKWVMIAGGVIVLIGAGMFLAGKFGIPIGRLPGDIRYETEKVSVYFPITTMILLSIILTVGLNLLGKFLNK